MSRRYFGTDGIRGTANAHPMTATVVQNVAMACARVLTTETQPIRRVVIGKDTRVSGYMLEQALTAGFLSMGVDVLLLGPMPTPGVAMLTRSLRADMGVMISASHNPYQDNGIKIFGADGYKLSDQTEAEIEALIDTDLTPYLAATESMGKASRIDDASGRYVENVKGTFPKGQNLASLKIVLDCANGAAYKVAPQILWELEAETTLLAHTPNGTNINDSCGATHTDTLQARVIAEKADMGIALDGDADRLIMVDEHGNRIDGDQLMGLIALTWKDRGLLSKNAIVATVMSNLGLERVLKKNGIDLIRTQVGDRYVSETMRQEGINLGGEQSGHIILSDYASTGDGLLAALQVLSVVKETGKPLSDLANIFNPVPQLLENVHVSTDAKTILSKPETIQAMKQAEQELNGSGRILVRPSGTEPLIRVMAEGDDEDQVRTVVQGLCTAIEQAA